jgi:hypothetical protein
MRAFHPDIEVSVINLFEFKSFGMGMIHRDTLLIRNLTPRTIRQLNRVIVTDVEALIPHRVADGKPY